MSDPIGNRGSDTLSRINPPMHIIDLHEVSRYDMPWKIKETPGNGPDSSINVAVEHGECHLPPAYRFQIPPVHTRTVCFRG